MLSIAPAGENLIPLANVLNNGGHSGGGGIGAIFGSKNLKALAIYGTKAVYVADSAKGGVAAHRAGGAAGHLDGVLLGDIAPVKDSLL